MSLLTPHSWPEPIWQKNYTFKYAKGYIALPKMGLVPLEWLKINPLQVFGQTLYTSSILFNLQKPNNENGTAKFIRTSCERKQLSTSFSERSNFISQFLNAEIYNYYLCLIIVSGIRFVLINLPKQNRVIWQNWKK